MRISGKKKTGLAALIFGLGLGLFVVVFLFSWKAEEIYRPKEPDLPNIQPEVDLAGCKHVYLDVGSNVGIQVRKLFEPELYPDLHNRAKVSSVFNTEFGTNIQQRRLNVCAVGFEPNVAHKQRLKDLESAYRRCGWKVHFFTETAVSDHNGIGTLFTGRKNKTLDFGANLLNGSGTLGRVTLLRLSEFVNKHVAKRKLKEDEPPGRIVMKMDIEGSEVDVLPDMISSGSLGKVHLLMIEWHEHQAGTQERKDASAAVRQLVEDGHFRVKTVDDESYGKSDFPLPNCDKAAQ